MTQDPTDPNAPAASDPTHPAWLTQPGASFDPASGAIHLASGQVLTVPPGATRDPNTGNINFGGSPQPAVPSGNGSVNPAAFGLPPNTATTPPPSGPAAPTDPNTPPSLGTFTPPDMLNLGGQPGLSYIPPTPTFTAPTFTAPSVGDALNDPGYQFRVQQGEAGLQNWAAARGTLNSSDTANALQDYGQNAASQEYQNVWNRDFSAYQGGTLPSWIAGTVNPAMQGYQTTAAAGEFQNSQNYLNSWNSFVNSQNNAKWFADHP